MQRRYRITQRLHGGLSVEVPADAIATTVSGWLAELGAESPLAGDLQKAVNEGDWPKARAIGEYLAVDVSMSP
ncbi:hypothetical protein [Mycolicibacterium gadium]|uniref:Uncharacterized protein n=1 Tax=Mycolicibacterium gadium TaxID=1794 RepID=A0ABT6GSU7_MYCGU|nr:hypothetical protein [Mycolicibacterium gadium]MDG5484525.1 hypothetical protein [Mycolicibacterium gadium]